MMQYQHGSPFQAETTVIKSLNSLSHQADNLRALGYTAPGPPLLVPALIWSKAALAKMFFKDLVMPITGLIGDYDKVFRRQANAGEDQYKTGVTQGGKVIVQRTRPRGFDNLALHKTVQDLPAHRRMFVKEHAKLLKPWPAISGKSPEVMMACGQSPEVTLASPGLQRPERSASPFQVTPSCSMHPPNSSPMGCNAALLFHEFLLASSMSVTVLTVPINGTCVVLRASCRPRACWKGCSPISRMFMEAPMVFEYAPHQHAPNVFAMWPVLLCLLQF